MPNIIIQAEISMNTKNCIKEIDEGFVLKENDGCEK